MHLACVNLRMTMEEALVAATINSAAALGMAEDVGSIEVGKRGDMLILSTARYIFVCYFYYLFVCCCLDGSI